MTPAGTAPSSRVGDLAPGTYRAVVSAQYIQGVGPIGAALKAGAEVVFCSPVWQDISLGGLSQDCSVVLHTHQRNQHVAFESSLSKKELSEQLGLQQHPRIRVPLAAARVSDQDRARLWGSVPPQEWGREAELGPHPPLSLGGKFPAP